MGERLRLRVDGRRYGTGTSRCIATALKGRREDGSKYAEALYRSRSGHYFIYAVGDRESPYSMLAEDGTRVGREAIVPLSERGARRWATENGHLGEFVASARIGSRVRPKMHVADATRLMVRSLAERGGGTDWDGALMSLVSIVGGRLVMHRFPRADQSEFRPTVSRETYEALRAIAPGEKLGTVVDSLAYCAAEMFTG